MNTNLKSLVVRLLLMAAALCPNVLFGQHLFRIGPAVGLNMASLSIAGTSDNAIHAGAVVGAVVELGVFPLGALSIQPHFVQKGTEMEKPYRVFGTTVQYSGPMTWNYIEIPVLLKFSLSPLPLSPHILVGPNFGFLLSASAESLEAGGNTAASDITNNAASTDVALDVGAGVEFGLLPLTSLTADLRYSLGLSNNNNSGTASANAIHTRDIKIIVGVLFGI